MTDVSFLLREADGGVSNGSWSPSARHLVADVDTAGLFHPPEPQSLRSPLRHGNPTDCVRSRHFRVYRMSNPDALIEAFLKLM
jgi:hypothetical protein